MFRCDVCVQVKLNDESMPLAHIALAVEGAAWDNPDNIPLMIANTIIGNYDRLARRGSCIHGKLCYDWLKNKHLRKIFLMPKYVYVFNNILEAQCVTCISYIFYIKYLIVQRRTCVLQHDGRWSLPSEQAGVISGRAEPVSQLPILQHLLQ